jgi:tetratricopeptide (TPR) repeat protein
MPRQPVIDILDEARAATVDQDLAGRARLTAALARELAHSVPAHRPRAGPLSAQALDLARASGDPTSLLACLLARHDVLWTRGTAAERLGLAHNIVELAQTLGDVEQRAEGLLLVANALLETGSAQFRPALDSCLEALGSLGQPRHNYTALTRLAALQLLDGDLDGAELRIEEAALLGERIGEPDAGNVRMSQRLALVQLRADPEVQRAFADEAVRWWIGAPVHAHAVAAGFLARAGDLEDARQHLDAVAELGGWRADRSYLWSVFISQIAEAAALLGDQQLCQQVLDDLRPFTDSCGVNGAVVAFAGSLSHPAGLVAATAGRTAEAAELFQHAARVHHRLQAPLWESVSREALATLTSVRPEHPGADVARLRRSGQGWTISYRSQTVNVPNSKGWHDLAQLLHQPGVDMHALELMGSPLRQGPAGEAADATAIGSYRARLHQLEQDRQDAEADHDVGRLSQVELESQLLLAELGRVTGLGTTTRPGSSGSSERARKAVSARIRDAIQRLTPMLPDIAAQLDRSIITGSWCRYRPEPTLTWHVEL